MSRQTRRRVLRLVLGLAAVLVLAMITGFRPLYWLVYVVVAGAAIGYLWAWLQSRRLDVEVHEVSIRPQVGHRAHLRVVVKEKSGLPRFGLRARLVGDFTSSEEEDFTLLPRGTATWEVSDLCRRRGLHSVGSLAVRSSDPTGLVGLECRVGSPRSVLVYPATVELSRTVSEGLAPGGELGEPGQLVGHSPAVSMVRRYVHGDSLTHIHWPTTARLGHLMTKEFEGAGINEIWIFVDMHGGVQFGSGADGTEEYLVTITASLARALIDAGHSVGLAMQGESLYRFPPRRDSEHLWALLRALALVKAEGRTVLASLISQETANLSGGTVAIVIAPWSGQSVGGIFQFLARRGILVVPIFLESSSFGSAAGPPGQRENILGRHELASVIRRDDDLATSLGNVLDRIASY